MQPDNPFLLFDDARPGSSGRGRLYREPAEQIAAGSLDEVPGALNALQSAVRRGAHAAGFIAYEAGYALDPALVPHARQGPTPLLWFGLFHGFEEVETEGWLPSPDGARASQPVPRVARADYLRAASEVREHLFAGDFYQANLTFGCDVGINGDPLALYARLRGTAQSAWGGVARHPDGWLLSLSPEQFFTIRGDAIEAKPMKGTALRGGTVTSDRAAAAALRSDPKQRAENLMIVDLLRNDLARVSVPGSVAVPDLFEVETYPTLHQMVSRVTARLRDGIDAVEVLRTIFPCGSVTGAPKIAAMAALRRLELEPRGAYTGSMGWIDPSGDCSFNVLIRTLEIGRESNRARLGLGSGLVVDSVPGNEWAECLAKGAFVTRPMQPIDLIETMRFDPQEGILELDRHLDRLAESSAALGFTYDRHAARNELQAATFGRRHPAMARMMLSPTGTMAVELKAIQEPDEIPVPVTLRKLPVPASDFRLHHKTTDRDFLDRARLEGGAFETVFVDEDGYLTEGSFTSLFVERGDQLVTPPIARGLMPGILRAKLLDEGQAVEGDLVAADLEAGFLIGNIVRGLIPARLVH